MSFQDPTGDTMTTQDVSIPPLVGYGADSTLNANSGADAIPTSMSTPPGATPGMGAPEPTASPQQLGGVSSTASSVAGGARTPEDETVEVTEMVIETLDDESWNARRTGLIVGVVAAGLAAGAGAAWFFINRRRAQQARLAATREAQIAQARTLLKMLPAQVQAAQARGLARLNPARRQLALATGSGAALTQRAGQSARDMTATVQALAESALAAAQDARDRAVTISQLLRDQSVSASQQAQDQLTDTWGRTRDTASISWDAAARTAKVARDAALHTVEVAREAAQQTADVARAESARTAKTARAGLRKAQRAATR